MAQQIQRKRAKAWSYKAGEKGKNRVRAYEADGQFWLDWQAPLFDKQGNRVIDPATGRQKKERLRLCLTAEGVTTRSEAIKKAEMVAEQFGESGPGAAEESFSGPLTLGRLLQLYLAEVVPGKKPATQRLNRMSARTLLAFFGTGAVVERIGPRGRPATEIGRVRYQAFLRARAEGTIRGYPHRARPQTIRHDVVFMLTVFRWAKTERDDGTVLLVRNPWEGFPVPKEDRPQRPVMTAELHDFLSERAPNWRMALVMDLCRETRRRMNSVRQLGLEDLDLTAGTVRWQGEFDKVGTTRVTPLTSRAILVVRKALALRKGEGLDGSKWLFPSAGDPSLPVSRDTLHGWMRQTKAKHGINVPRLGYHGEKRAGIRDARFRALPPKVQEELAGTTWETLRTVYDYVDLPELRLAVRALEEDPAPAASASVGGALADAA